MNTKNIKRSYVFTLVLSGKNEITTELEDTLFESGCDDALVYSNNSSVFLEFDRADTSLQKAVLSAIKDVEKNKNIEVAVVEPADFVTIAEIARRAGMSREYIRKLVNGERGAGGFPTPLAGTSSKTLIYSWVEVSAWLSENKVLKNNDDLKGAIIIKQFNDQLNNRRKLLNSKTVKAKEIYNI